MIHSLPMQVLCLSQQYSEAVVEVQQCSYNKNKKKIMQEVKI